MSANTLIPRFKYTKTLNHDQGGRRLCLLGTIGHEPALLLAERAPFATDEGYVRSINLLVKNVNNLGDNDIYHWYMANSLPENGVDQPTPPDVKINLIYPCKESHIRKYSFQQSRSVTETPDIYVRYMRPYMERYREEGRLNWVFNILEGRTEQEDIVFRSHQTDKNDDFLLLPDLNWDRTTIGSLHLLGIVERRDIWSVRDLKKSHVPWLKHLRETLIEAVTKLYSDIESDMLKLYIHYQPTYYHFHIHVVHINLDPTATQGVGKALALDHIISQLETMAGGDDAGMAEVSLTYNVGEASDIWRLIYQPLKLGKQPDVTASS
ncbi:scavenger mRNA decapping enzyme [Polychaeton citri CBS 116435]|uniref:Scavenger mRNA decapping enzyme n=1 Tax=Polychaeton citri CBS 116435 TaxID=1314669 RepID=A0A9P4Q4E6_9PEZI|nr:scavenger mRNA decapping enzyme [Polychaeton citri CBS 116435]